MTDDTNSETKERPPLPKRFDRYHADNPKTYQLFVRFAREALSRGHHNFGAAQILGRVRWETNVELDEVEDFKMDQSYAAFYARLFMMDYPEYGGFFRTKNSVADAYFAQKAAELAAQDEAPDLPWLEAAGLTHRPAP